MKRNVHFVGNLQFDGAEEIRQWHREWMSWRNAPRRWWRRFLYLLGRHP